MGSASEQRFIDTPGYWLAPAIVAFAAWINDDPDLANRALKESLHRDARKTELLFALICRSANRLDASRRWTIQYLNHQSAAELDHETIVLIDAYANGILGVDSQHRISKIISSWLDELSKDPKFETKAVEQWQKSLSILVTNRNNVYPMLAQYSAENEQLERLLNNVHINEKILEHFKTIYERPNNISSVKRQLDEILQHLTNDHDEEESELYQKRQYNQYIKDYDGDKDRAKQAMAAQENKYHEKNNFLELLTFAAMETDANKQSIATQKLAIALSKNWILQAYNNIIASYQGMIPQTISFSVFGYDGSTSDGANEAETLDKFKNYQETARKKALEEIFLNWKEFLVPAIVLVVGLFILHSPSPLMFLFIAIVIGYGVFKYLGLKADMEKERTRINQQFDNYIAKGNEIIYSIMAEVVDLRREYRIENEKSEDVKNFLDGLSAEKYISSLDEVHQVVL